TLATQRYERCRPLYSPFAPAKAGAQSSRGFVCLAPGSPLVRGRTRETSPRSNLSQGPIMLGCLTTEYVQARAVLRRRYRALAAHQAERTETFVEWQAGQCGRERRAHTCIHQSGEDLVLLEPVRHLAPGCLGSLLAVALPIVGMEAVRRARIG